MDPAHLTNDQTSSDNAEMAPKNETAADNDTDGGSSADKFTFHGKVPSQSDIKFFFTVMENLKAKPDADWEAVKTVMGLKDVKCTRERWRQTMKKYEIEFPEALATSAKAVRGKKAAATSTDADADAEGAGEPSAPKPKTPRGKKATAMKSAEKAVSDDEPGVDGHGATPPNDDNAASPATPATPTPAAPTPAKTPRSRKSSAKKRASPEQDEGADPEEGTPAKKKPAPRKPRGPNKKTMAAQAAAAKASDDASTEVADNAGPSANPGPDTSTSNDTEMKEAATTEDTNVADAAKEANNACS